MSDGPYGRHGFNANAGGYGGGASYGNAAGGGYAAPSYGQSYGAGASYSAPAPQDGAYGSQYGAYGGNGAYQVRRTVIVGCLPFLAVLGELYNPPPMPMPRITHGTLSFL